MQHVEEMSCDELESRDTELKLDLAEVNARLESARTRAATTGDYADRRWYSRAIKTRRVVCIELQLVQREIGKRNKEERARKTNSVDRRFIAAARRELAPELFQALMEEAKEGESPTDAVRGDCRDPSPYILATRFAVENGFTLARQLADNRGYLIEVCRDGHRVGHYNTYRASLSAMQELSNLSERPLPRAHHHGHPLQRIWHGIYGSALRSLAVVLGKSGENNEDRNTAGNV